MIKLSYNEYEYLLDPKAIHDFEIFGKLSQDNYDEEKDIYYKALKYYDRLIDEIASFLQHLGFSSNLECTNMITYLIKNGYLSNDCFLIKGEIPSRKEITHRFGTTIVRSNGCCRNYVGMVDDVLKVLDIPTDKLYCYAGDPKIGIDRQVNHVINLVSQDDTAYGIDTYNGNRLFRFDNAFLLSDVNPDSSSFLLYKPYQEIMLGERDYVRVIRKIRSLKSLKGRPTISYKDYKDDILDYVEDKMKSQEDDLMDFHNHTKRLKRKIVRNINSVQN